VIKILDLTRQRFGRLLVLKQSGGKKRGCILWLCKCDCGNTVIVPSGDLRTPRKRSCGCLQKEVASLIGRTGNNRRTHGMKGTKIYHVWDSIKYRCLNPNYRQWKDYGGRGVTICDEWAKSFEAFYDYVSKLPNYRGKGYSIDRINNDGNYEPGNVRWATRIEQNRNRRNVLGGRKSNAISYLYAKGR
jgi:hypothetical protein